MIIGLYSKSTFTFIRNAPAVFQSDCSILHSKQNWMKVSVIPHAHQHLVLSVFWILAIPTGISLFFQSTVP